MAKIFLDTNYFIDAIYRRPEKKILETLEGYSVYISTLSIHIYCYVYNIKIPNSGVAEQIGKFQVVDFSEIVLNRSLVGPTGDFEDNVQLHSAAEADCNVFLTNDKKIKALKYFGKIKIGFD